MTLEPPSQCSDRRQFLKGSVAVASTVFLTKGRASESAEQPAAPESAARIVRNSRPLDLETPVKYFDEFLTPIPAFFVRSHFGEPAVGLAPWTLTVESPAGVIQRIRLAQLDALERFEFPAVLQCAGNGRALFRPRIPGLAWEKGAVGNASWSGVRLADVIMRFGGVLDGVKHVHFYGLDRPPSPKTPAYLRSIPIERALDTSTLLATHMNGVPLPVLHGGPLRVVLPGWTGNHWIKWVRRIVLSPVEAPGFYQQTGYKMPRSPLTPEQSPPPDALQPVTWQNVKSLIALPHHDSRVKLGPIAIQGVAWTGPGLVERIEVSCDGTTWQPAQWLGEARAGTWRLWRADWTPPRAGMYSIRSRATDTNGQTQPDATPWNKSGYLWNGVDHVTFEVV